MAIPASYMLPPLPPGLEGLAELALDLRWSWNHATDRLWEYIDANLWRTTGNPWLVLQTAPASRIESLSRDAEFIKLLNDSLAEHHQSMAEKTWFQQAHTGQPFSVTYFSMEYGLSEALPIYSGGMGILAGDILKTSSDLGVPVVGIGLLYQQGYFRQTLDAQGEQTELYPYNDPSQLPIMPVRNHRGEWLRIRLEFPGRILWLRSWEARVGRVKLYLLDSNDPMNSPADRGITSELYGGGPEIRFQQEIILGIAGWRLVDSLGIKSEVCHLNEGHAALAVLERARCFMMDTGQSFGSTPSTALLRHGSGQVRTGQDRSFEVALAATRTGNIFTTHTPVEAGFDRFSPELVSHYMGGYAEQLGIDLKDLLALGRLNPHNAQEKFNMAYLALRGSGAVNAVSRLHGEVSRTIFQPLFPRWPQSQVPVTHITNGVHMPSWDSAAADVIWTDACGKGRWLTTVDKLEVDLKKVSDESLWQLRMEGAQQLIRYIRVRLARQLAGTGAPPQVIDRCDQLLDPSILTIGFARRITGYKRPNLLLHDPERLTRIINHPRWPLQLIIAGKAHPQDEEGKELVRAWWQFSRRPEVGDRVVFLSDYDLALAGQLVQGVDLWINTPRRPWEACGTSGMKVLVNGGLNISERDGWWAEAYRPEVGWAIGDGQEHDSDPAWDAQEAEQLYRLLEEEIVPAYYERDEKGIPAGWITRMRASMAELTPQFSTNRMLTEYVDRLYKPAAQRYRKRAQDKAKEASALVTWRKMLDSHWSKLRFGGLDVQNEDNGYLITVVAFLDEVDPQAVQVQLYADAQDGGQPEIIVMEPAQALAGSQNGWMYRARIQAGRPAEDYTPRIVPFFDGAAVPLEAPNILWYEP